MIRRLAIATAVALAALWLWLLVSIGALDGGPGGRSFGNDFAISMGGAAVVHDHGNPYDRQLLLPTEQRYLLAHGVPTSLVPNSSAYNRMVIRVGNPSLFFWALQPLLSLPFQPVALGWLVSCVVLVSAGLLGTLTAFGWRNKAFPVLLFVGAPPVTLAVYYGNVNCVMFAALGIALGIMRRNPVAAGAILSAAWLKPQVGLPCVALVVLFEPAVAKHLLVGFAVASVALTSVTVAFMGAGNLAAWITSMLAYPEAMPIQPDLASASGAYGPHTSPHLRTALEALALFIAAAALLVTWWRARTDHTLTIRNGAGLWFVVLLAVPFAHYHDLILLTPALVAILGRDAQNLARPAGVAALLLVYLSVVAVTIRPDGFNALSFVVAALAICVFAAGRQSGHMPRQTRERNRINSSTWPTLYPRRATRSFD